MEREAVESASGCNLWVTEDNTGHHPRTAVEETKLPKLVLFSELKKKRPFHGTNRRGGMS